MFPSSSNGINYSTPFFPHITCPSLKYEHLQLEPSFLNPCYSYCFHNEISSHQENIPMADFAGNNGKSQILTRKRCAKRDRHSKIDTAQGPRDRRMRLPLKVAREFFDLQDQLSFDKASKTIEWLMVQASSEIEQLSRNATVNRAVSSSSECEAISEMNEEDEAAAAVRVTPKSAKTTSCRKGKRAKSSALRAKVRTKARERTTEKQQTQGKTAQSHYLNPEAPATSAGGSISGESWTAVGKWSPFPDLSHLYNLGFPQEQNEMEDFQFCRSMWE